MRAGTPGHDLGTGNHRAERQSAGDALGAGEDVGRNSEVVAGPHAAGPSHAALNLIMDQENPVVLRNCGELFEEDLGRSNIAAFALDRLHHDSRYFFSRYRGAEKLVLDE